MADGYILTDEFINKIDLGAKKQKKFSVGNGFYLLVTTKGKYWRYNFRFDDKSQTLALGVYPTISVEGARIAHKIAWAKVKKGINPCAEKRVKKINNKPLKVENNLGSGSGLYIRAISEERFDHAMSLFKIHRQTVGMWHRYLDEYSLELEFEGELSSSLYDALKVLGVTKSKDRGACEAEWRRRLDEQPLFVIVDYVDWVLSYIDRIKKPVTGDR